MRYQSYLHSASLIIDSYKGAEPLSSFLKKFFAANKKYGATDRRQIASLCYNYYRLGRSLHQVPVEERIIIATFLCEHAPHEFIQFHRPAWHKHIGAATAEKVSIINDQLLIDDIFPWKDELSEGIDQHQLALSYLQQPNLFLRIRPGKKAVVLNKLQEAGLTFQLMDEDIICLPNASKLDGIIELDKEAVVQDLNSQKVLDILKNREMHSQRATGSEHPVTLWDCCAASGGKSILAYDILQGKVKLTVSDIRESVLHNLKKRFSLAGVSGYKAFITDISTADCQLPATNCELLICDAPCTGSGTWSRTPEQLFYFDPAAIRHFTERQKKIVSNTITSLASGGLFFYITCSVFAAENEKIAAFIKEKFHLQLLQMELLKGYDKQADNMFVAVFSK